MLPIANRLRKKKEVENVFAHGRAMKLGHLLCRTVPNNLPVSRFCFVVSKKVSRKAVDRNRLRRCLREAIKSRLSRLEGGWDCSLVALAGLEAEECRQIKEITARLLARAGMANNPT